MVQTLLAQSDTIEERVEELEAVVYAMQSHQHEQTKLMLTIHKLSIKQDERMDALESRMDSLENRMDSVEKRLDSIEKRLDAFEGILLALNHNVLVIKDKLSA